MSVCLSVWKHETHGLEVVLGVLVKGENEWKHLAFHTIRNVIFVISSPFCSNTYKTRVTKNM